MVITTVVEALELILSPHKKKQRKEEPKIRGGEY